MQPSTLHRLIHTLGIDPEEAGRKLFRRQRSPLEDRWLARIFQTFLISLCAAPLVAMLLQCLGVSVDWPKLAVGVAVGGTLGALIGAFIAATRGTVGGASLAFALGVAFGLAGRTQPPQFEPQLARDLAEKSAEATAIIVILCLVAVAAVTFYLSSMLSSIFGAREITRLARANDFRAIRDLQGSWLPGLQGADRLLLGFSDAARYLVAAQTSFGAYHRLNHLRGFAQTINALETQMRSERKRQTKPFEESARALREAGDQMRTQAEKEAVDLLPNPFRPGDALTYESGRELFRGRETAIRDIENALSDATRSLSLQLLAPRRSGKTSLLKMLPNMVPDAVCVFFDLQANPADSLASFWKNLAEKALIQAKIQRRIDLPALPDGPPIEAANAWLQSLDHLPNGRRVLIAIDEFERLEDLFPFSKQELLQLMGLLRATIQHRRNVRILVSGAAPFDELDPIWDDHFINTRQIKLPFLDQATSIDLLTQPSADFPAGTIPYDVALEVFRRAGGQPFLLQIFGYLLVDHLNTQKRQVAFLADVNCIETRAIDWAEPYFRDMHKDAPPETREALAHLAQGETVTLGPRTTRWLAQRYLLTPEDTLAIPLFASWLERYAPA